MAATPSPELLATIGSDLIHLMDSAQVPDEVQKKYYEAQVDSVRSFGALVETGTAMRELLKKEFNFDEMESLVTRAKVPKVIVAWGNARARTAKHAEIEAEVETRDVPKKAPLPDFFSIRKTFEDDYGTATDDMIPGSGLMERRSR